MGGNREEITVPCTLMARLLTLAAMATGDPSIERAVAMMDEAELCEREAESLLREGVKITVRPYAITPLLTPPPPTINPLLPAGLFVSTRMP